MANNYLTPGVYVRETSTLPGTVEEVRSAIPAFIGYTGNARYNGRNLPGVPEQITSFKDFAERFGGPAKLDLKAINIKTDMAVRFSAIDSVQLKSRHLLYEAVYMYFNNGGGECFVVSTGTYGDKLDKQPFLDALEALEAVDGVTLIVMPEAVLLGESLYDVQQAALAHCAKLKNRFAILDIRELTEETGREAAPKNDLLLNWRHSPSHDCWRKSWQEFRDRIGVQGLCYGAAYTPYLVADTPVHFKYDDLRRFFVVPSGDPADPAKDCPGNVSLSVLDPASKKHIQKIENALLDRDKLTDAIAEAAMTMAEHDDKSKLPEPISAAAKAVKDNTNLVATAYVRLFAAVTGVDQASLEGDGLGANKFFNDHAMSSEMVQRVFDQLNHVLSRIAAFKPKAADDACAALTDKDNPDAVKLLNSLYSAIAAAGSARVADIIDIFEELLVTNLYESIDMNVNRLSNGLYANSPVYRSIHQAVASAMRVQPPSAAMAGIYAATDRARGVWKAPANVSLSNVLGLTQTITADAQETLNSDSVAGKSINALRQFPGKGYLVWGARTLDGNSLEWRYIPVRRFFIMVEESLRRATAMLVFEPNDATLWAKAKALIDNYLLQKWKDGALMGASPAEAYFVNVGLGSSMTEQDILEGRLIVDIGMAVVRPAEFITLRLMQMMQQA